MGDVEKTEVTGVSASGAFFLTERDQEILSMTDEEYKLQTWEELKSIIAANALEKLTRRPTTEQFPKSPCVIEMVNTEELLDALAVPALILLLLLTPAADDDDDIGNDDILEILL